MKPIAEMLGFVVIYALLRWAGGSPFECLAGAAIIVRLIMIEVAIERVSP